MTIGAISVKSISPLVLVLSGTVTTPFVTVNVNPERRSADTALPPCVVGRNPEKS